MRIRSTLAASLLCAALAGCDSLTGSGPSLLIEGRVRTTLTGDPISGATVVIGYTGIFRGTSGTLGTRTTDAMGRFDFQVTEIPGFSYPNCSAIVLSVTAPGYAPQSYAIQSPPGDIGCEASGTASVELQMSPIEAGQGHIIRTGVERRGDWLASSASRFLGRAQG